MPTPDPVFRAGRRCVGTEVTSDGESRAAASLLDRGRRPVCLIVDPDGVDASLSVRCIDESWLGWVWAISALEVDKTW